MQNIRFSLIIPVYKNQENIPDLLDALHALSNRVGSGFEVVFVVDASPDRSWDLLQETLPAQPYSSQLILLSRNFGSFLAIRAGLETAQGAIIAVMAADLQEPPELIERFFEVLSTGQYDIALGQRTDREDAPVTQFLSNTFWNIYRRFVLPDIPKGGVDIFACTRQVRDALLQLQAHNTSLIAQLFWVGFRRIAVPYTRRKRTKGKSAWVFKKRLKYLLDSIFSFSDMPIMILVWLGLAGISITFVVALIVLAAKLMGFIEVQGYTALVMLILFVFATLLLSQGIMGCYLWRCLENTKRAPLTLTQCTHHFDGNLPSKEKK